MWHRHDVLSTANSLFGSYMKHKWWLLRILHIKICIFFQMIFLSLYFTYLEYQWPAWNEFAVCYSEWEGRPSQGVACCTPEDSHHQGDPASASNQDLHFVFCYPVLSSWQTAWQGHHNPWNQRLVVLEISNTNCGRPTDRTFSIKIPHCKIISLRLIFCSQSHI